MKDLIIIGAGDMGREVAWIVEGINEAEYQSLLDAMKKIESIMGRPMQDKGE